MTKANEIRKIIDEGRNFLVVSHANPEGDAAGSSLALHLTLKAMGKKSALYNKDGFPKNFSFLPGFKECSREAPEERFDATMVVDCGDEELIGIRVTGESRFGKIINIDHHRTNTNFGDIRFIEPQASAAGEVLFHLFSEAGIGISREAAICLYTAIHTDSGSFRYANTTSETHRVVSELLKLGVKPDRVAEGLYEAIPAGRLRLMGRVFETLDFAVEGRAASTHVTLKMLEETGSKKDAVEGFINYVNSIEGVLVAVMFRETEEGFFKVSFRSRRGVDVSKIASVFGGGGHYNAAGCKLTGKLEDVKKTVYGILEKELKAYHP